MTVERRVADPYEFRLTRRRTRGVAQSCFLRTPSMHYHEETFQAFQSDFASAVLSVAATGSMSLNIESRLKLRRIANAKSVSTPINTSS